MKNRYSVFAKWACGLTLAASILAAPSRALADDAPPLPDARQMGYGSDVAPIASSSASLWLLFMGLGAAALGVMFVSSNRSHLD